MEANNNVVVIQDDEPEKNSSLAQHVAQLAIQLNYNGTLNIGALEDEIRFYQQRSVEACLELGKRLLILKEITPHGDFTQRIELLGITLSTARRFMSATLKFSNQRTFAVLGSVHSQTKLLELVTLDDDDLEALSEGGTVAGLTLDAIETMSVRELKKALRDAKADNNSKDQLIENKNNKIDELDTKLNRRRAPEQAVLDQQEDEKAALALIELQSEAIITAMQTYQVGMNEALQYANLPGITEAIHNAMHYTYQRIAQLALDCEISIDFSEIVTPSWQRDMQTTTNQE